MSHTIEYENYLKSREWKLKRQARLKYDRHRCAICETPDSGENKLQVHHLTYERFMHENIETDLISLCPKCHRKLHKALGYGTDWKRRSR